MDNESGIWVPAEQLAQAERERDEARHERDEARAGRAEWEAVAIKYLPYKRERDEARAALAVERQHRDGHLPSCAGIDREEGRCGCGYLDGTAYRDMTERMEQAVALLREWREDDGLPAATHTSKRGRTDAFLAGQPAPAKPVVNDAMVERALSAYLRYAVDARAGMRAALVAALEGRG